MLQRVSWTLRNKMYPTKYKTKWCPAFLKGKCKRGKENCLFAHDENELRESWARLYLINETPEDYRKITLPYIQSTEDLNWIYRILEHRSEQNRVVFEDPDSTIGFVLIHAPHDQRSFHLLAFVRQCGIKSIRDLTAEHIPLLENIKHKSSQMIKKKFNLEPHQLKFFFHYQPSCYHLHVHIQHDAIKNGERDVILEEVIENLNDSSDFYKKTTLPFIGKEGEPLLEKFRKAGKQTTRVV
uniref:C3H1-type domain-containing protein n=1 Tax=Acrobeloides nanus TaxID=290746 RepID=A0A914BYQ1_9BILA